METNQGNGTMQIDGRDDVPEGAVVILLVWVEDPTVVTLNIEPAAGEVLLEDLDGPLPLPLAETTGLVDFEAAKTKSTWPKLRFTELKFVLFY